jgi:hypothetical protein
VSGRTSAGEILACGAVIHNLPPLCFAEPLRSVITARLISAATSLSDIVRFSQVVGCFAGTTSDPAKQPGVAKLKDRNGATGSERPQSSVAFMLVNSKLNSVTGWRAQEHTTSGVGAISGSGDCPSNAPDLAQSKKSVRSCWRHAASKRSRHRPVRESSNAWLIEECSAPRRTNHFSRRFPLGDAGVLGVSRPDNASLLSGRCRCSVLPNRRRAARYFPIVATDNQRQFPSHHLPVSYLEPEPWGGRISIPVFASRY